MLNSTTNTYILKREILNFSNKISRNLSKPERLEFPQIVISYYQFFLPLILPL